MLRVDGIRWIDDKNAILNITVTRAKELPNLGDVIGGATVNATSTASIESNGTRAKLNASGVWVDASNKPVTPTNALPSEIIVAEGVSVYPPSELTAPAKASSELARLVDGGGKNIIINNVVQIEKNDVKAVINPDKSITISGVSNKSTAFVLCYDLADPSKSNRYSTKVPVQSGIYVLAGTHDPRIRIQAWVYTDSTDCTSTANSSEDVTFGVTKPYISFCLYVAASADFTEPLTIYPMCCLSDAYTVSQNYVPRTLSPEELTAEFADLSKYENPVAVSWDDGHFINSSGQYKTDTNYSVSSPIPIRKGQRIVFNATGASSVSILTKYTKDGTVTPLIDGSANAPLRFIVPKKFWVADEDCELRITHRITASGQSTIISNANVKPVIYNDEQFLCTSPLWGKKIIAFGDSLLHGSKIGEYPTWLNWIAGKYRMTAINQGINGSSIAVLPALDGDDDHDPIVLRYGEVLDAHPDTDIVVIQGGANDRTQAVPIGETDSSDNTDFCGALNLIIDGIRQKCPKAKVFMISVPWRWTTASSINLRENDYAEAMEAVGAAKSIPVRNSCKAGDIDFRDANMQAWADEGLVPNVSDPAAPNRHYSPEGYQYIIPSIEKFLSQ